MLRYLQKTIKIIAEKCSENLSQMLKQTSINKNEITRDLFVAGFIDDEMKKRMNKIDSQMVITGN